MVDSIAQTEMPKPDKKPEPNYENINRGFEVLQSMRSYVDAIPTPGRDAGDLTGDFSLFAITKDVLSGALTLMEAPYKPTRDEDIFQAVLDMGPGMASVATKAPVGAIGMFGSKPGLWAAKEIHERYGKLVERAEHMQSVGDPEEKIWQSTGISKDHEGNWRYEISDGNNTQVDWLAYDNMSKGWNFVNDPEFGPMEVLDETPSKIKLGDILLSPQVYEHWPELKNIEVTGYRGQAHNGEFAHYNIHTNSIHLNLDKLDLPETEPAALRRTLVHEAQHALQQLQGRPSGTNPDWAREQMKLALTRVAHHANNARNRGDLTDEQNAAVRKALLVNQKWKQVEAIWGDMAAYYADPGEVEASLTELSLRGDQDRFHPKDRVGRGVVHPDFQFRPEDLNFPARPDDMTIPGKKPFGTKGTSQMAHPMDDPNFKNLPPEVQNIIKNEVPPSLDPETGMPVVDVDRMPIEDNLNIDPKYYQTVIDSKLREAQNFREAATDIITGRNRMNEFVPEDVKWETANSFRLRARTAEEAARFYQELKRKGAP